MDEKSRIHYQGRLLGATITGYTAQQSKQRLLAGQHAYKKTALAEGQSEADWQVQTQELDRLVNDELAIAGFYQSCQVCGVK